MGVECVCVPRRATHLMFLPVLGSNESGRPFSAETMFRDQAWPHWGWSADAQGKDQPATSTHHIGRLRDNATFIITPHREAQPTQTNKKSSRHSAGPTSAPDGLKGCWSMVIGPVVRIGKRSGLHRFQKRFALFAQSLFQTA